MKITGAILFVFLACVALLVAQTSGRGVSPGEGASGRYQIVVSPAGNTNNFLLDTQTGRVWQFTRFTDLEDEPTAWLIQTRLDTLDQIQKWAMAHVSKR